MTSFRDFLMEAKYDIYTDLDNYIGGGDKIWCNQTLRECDRG